MNARPTSLTAVCIVLFILGTFGLLGSLAGLASSALTGAATDFSEFQNELLESQAEADPELAQMLEAQQELQGEMMAMAERWQSVTLGLALVGLLVSLGMLYGAFRAWGGHPSAPGLLTKVLAAALVLTLGQAIVGYMQAQEARPAMEQMMGSMGATELGDDPEAAAMMESFGSMAATIGMVASLGWNGIQALIYLLGLWTIRQPSSVAFFGSGDDEGGEPLPA